MGLYIAGEYTSDLGEVWDEVAALHAKLGTVSPTAAMKDAYVAKETDIDSALAAFEVQPGHWSYTSLSSTDAVRSRESDRVRI